VKKPATIHYERCMETACGRRIMLPVSKYPRRTTDAREVNCEECYAWLVEQPGDPFSPAEMPK
jgi:hypothetical protein